MQIKLQKYFFSSLLKPLEILLVQNAILTKVLCYKQITKESSILVVRNGRLLPFYFYSTRNRPRMALTMGMKKQRNFDQCLHTAIPLWFAISINISLRKFCDFTKGKIYAKLTAILNILYSQFGLKNNVNIVKDANTFDLGVN